MVTKGIIPSSYVSLEFATKKDIMEFVGPYGPWQRRIFTIIFLVYMHVATHNMYLVFVAPNHRHTCASTSEAVHISTAEWKTLMLPSKEQECFRFETLNLSNSYQLQPSEFLNVSDLYHFQSFEYMNSSDSYQFQIFEFMNLSNTSLPAENENDTDIIQAMQCETWVYDRTFYTNTLVSQFDLVCEQKWLISLSKSIFMVGILISVVISGHVADRFGRRPVLILASFITSIFATVCAFSTSITMFIVIRFFVAIGLGGFYNTAFILFMEILVPEMRSVYGIAVQLGWCLGILCLPAISWCIRNWFWIQITVTVPSFILTIILLRIPESPRWLLARGKSEKARKILIEAAEENGIQLTGTEIMFEKAIFEASQFDSAKPCKSLLDLLKVPVMRKITLTLFFVWFVNSMIYFGLSFNTNELYGNPFVNFALSGAVEIPAYFLAIFVIKSKGRRIPLIVSLIVGAVLCLVRYGLPRASSLMPLYVVISMVGKFFISCAFGILLLFTSELFPTAVRNIGLGSTSMCKVLGTILAPYIRELGDITSYPGISFFIYGVFSAVGGAIVLCLPETTNVTIPDSLEEFVQVLSTKKEEKSALLDENKENRRTRFQEMSTNSVNISNNSTRSVN